MGLSVSWLFTVPSLHTDSIGLRLLILAIKPAALTEG